MSFVFEIAEGFQCDYMAFFWHVWCEGRWFILFLWTVDLHLKPGNIYKYKHISQTQLVSLVQFLRKTTWATHPLRFRYFLCKWATPISQQEVLLCTKAWRFMSIGAKAETLGTKWVNNHWVLLGSGNPRKCLKKSVFFFELDLPGLPKLWQLLWVNHHIASPRLVYLLYLHVPKKINPSCR